MEPSPVGLDVWVIFDHPRDYPDAFVLRRQTVFPDGTIVNDPVCVTATSIERVRARLPRGVVQVQWPGQDPDPVIVEAWV
jgi:hypothetical protein